MPNRVLFYKEHPEILYYLPEVLSFPEQILIQKISGNLGIYKIDHNICNIFLEEVLTWRVGARIWNLLKQHRPKNVREQVKYSKKPPKYLLLCQDKISRKIIIIYLITRILSGILINANLVHTTLIYLALINVPCRFS